MPGNGFFRAQRTERPGARRLRVSHGLKRREGFRRHNKQSLFGVEVARRFRKVCAVDVRDEAERHVAGAVVAQSFVGHDWAEV